MVVAGNRGNFGVMRKDWRARTKGAAQRPQANSGVGQMGAREAPWRPQLGDFRGHAGARAGCPLFAAGRAAIHFWGLAAHQLLQLIRIASALDRDR